ncbi:hypothetical protein [Spongiivirga citrea]|uniref:Uncharacterized protein n=1 Tax=Spongiivirga citrea TaxID=1481457 RepID=A0A6M0CKF7_9FLAO|nr:hypothetical protein [Spongiivirga citrea]NER15897.1 hypothetical protein [Spongiivirga citrea]
MAENSNRENIFNTIEKVEDDFEKKITQISAGALALSITFIDKIVDLSKAEHFWILIVGWILLTLTLSINLISILVSRKLNLQTIDEYDDFEREKIKEEELIKNVKKRNKFISNLDIISLAKLLSGIFMIVIFSSININNKSKIDMPDKDRIEKGRTIHVPQTNPQSSDTGNEKPNQNTTESNDNQDS